MNKIDSFFALTVDERVRVQDSREIDEQTLGPSLLIDRLLQETVVFRGTEQSGVFVQEIEDVWRHGLNASQLALSTTPHGKCWKMVPCAPEDEGAVEIHGEYRKRVPIVSQEVVEAWIESRSSEQLTALYRRFQVSSPEELLARLSHEKRQNLILDKEAYFFSEIPAVAQLTLEECRAVFGAYNAFLRSKQKGVDEQNLMTAKSVIKNFKSVVGEDFTHRQIWDEVSRLYKAWEVRARILGENEDSEMGAIEPLWPRPEEPIGWGIHKDALPFMASRKAYREWVQSECAWSKGRYEEFASEQGLSLFNVNALNQFEVPSWKELQNATLRVQQEYEARLEEWQSQTNLTQRWANLGHLVSEVTSDGEVEDEVQFGNYTYDIRPRPGIARGPNTLMNPEEEYYKRTLSSSNTPDLIRVFMGATGLFVKQLPYDQKSAAEGRLVQGGHPMAERIEEFFTSLGSSRDPLKMGLLDSADEWRVLRLSGKQKLETFVLGDRMVKGFYTSPEFILDDEGNLVPNVGKDGERLPPFVEVLREIDDFSKPRRSGEVFVRIHNSMPNRGYTHELKSNDLLRELFPDSPPPVRMRFKSRVEYLATVFPLRRVPVLTLAREESFSEDSDTRVVSRVVWKRASEVFPALCAWVSAASEGFNSFEEGIDDFYEGDIDLLEEVNIELMFYRKQMQLTLVAANRHLMKDIIDDVHQAMISIACEPDLLESRSFEDFYGNLTYPYTAFFGKDGRGRIWSALKRIQGTSSEIRLPEESESNPSLFWRAMGWTLNGRVPAPPSLTKRWVEHYFYRVNPASPRVWTVNDEPLRLPALYRVPISGERFSCGVLGDLCALFKSMLFPLEIPALPGLFRFQEEDLCEEDVPPLEFWRRTLYKHVNRVVSVEEWSVEFQHRIHKVMLGWNRRPEISNPKFGSARKNFFDELFPRLEENGLVLEKKVLSEPDPNSEESSVKLRAERMKRLQERNLEKERSNRLMRLLLLSRLPVVTAKLVNNFCNDINLEKSRQIMGQYAEALGPIEAYLRTRS